MDTVTKQAAQEQAAERIATLIAAQYAQFAKYWGASS